MEKREGGYFISTEEIKQAGKILGMVGIGCLIVGVVRSRFGAKTTDRCSFETAHV